MKKVTIEVSQRGHNDYLVRLISDKGRERYIVFTYWADDRIWRNKFAMMTNVFAVAKYLGKRFKCRADVNLRGRYEKKVKNEKSDYSLPSR